MTAFTIAPIGTCRIHTPLRDAVGRYPIKLQLGRNYGFVHTAAEALQQARFMFGQSDIPADVQRLIFRPSNGEQARRGTHKPADLYVVELSSRKLLTIDVAAVIKGMGERMPALLDRSHGKRIQDYTT